MQSKCAQPIHIIFYISSLHICQTSHNTRRMGINNGKFFGYSQFIGIRRQPNTTHTHTTTMNRKYSISYGSRVVCAPHTKDNSDFSFVAFCFSYQPKPVVNAVCKSHSFSRRSLCVCVWVNALWFSLRQNWMDANKMERNRDQTKGFSAGNKSA